MPIFFTSAVEAAAGLGPLGSRLFADVIGVDILIRLFL
jgi:hypothetical protein